MQYISEINAFNKLCETTYIPANSQLMWFRLMHLSNTCGWREWITVDNLRLMSMTQIKTVNTLTLSRKHLIDYGLIEFKKGKKGQPSKYKLNSVVELLGVKNTVQSLQYNNCTTIITPNTEPNSEPNTELFPEPNPAHINRLDIDKTNNIYAENENPQKDDQSAQKLNKQKSGKQKHKYGEYGHVLLTDEQADKLRADFPGLFDAMVVILDEYKETSGRVYKNDNLVMRKWVAERAQQESVKKPEISADRQQAAVDIEDEVIKQMEREYEELMKQGEGNVEE